MGKSCTAVLFVAGTDVIPDVDRCRWRDVVRTGDDAQPVLQCVLGDRVGKPGKRALSHVPHHSTSPELNSPPGQASVSRTLDDGGTESEGNVNIPLPISNGPRIHIGRGATCQGCCQGGWGAGRGG